MDSPANLNAAAYIVIKHGNRRRLLSKPPSFDALMSRACEIFEFAPNTQVCAYFQYRNHLDNYVEMELDPSAYHFLKTGDELEWKCFDKSAPNTTSAGGDHGPRYLGFGNTQPTTANSNWEGFDNVPFRGYVASESPSSMRGFGSTPKNEQVGSVGGDEGPTYGWGQAPDNAVRSSHGNGSGGGGWGTTSGRNSWGDDVFTTDASVSGGGGGNDSVDGWLRRMPRGPLQERPAQTRWAPESSPPRRRRHQGGRE